MKTIEQSLANFPRAVLTHTPTPLHKLSRLSAEFAPCVLYVKRDDCTGLAMGGNKARQLEFYLGEAMARGCDTVLSTGAVQSNYMRMLAAGAAKLGLACHIQLESRVDNHSDDYQHSGNVLLDRLFGAQVHRYPSGEDEHGADAALRALADELAGDKKKPYIIPLAAGHAPTGALGYVVAAAELVRQVEQDNLPLDLIAVGSGSGLTHAGLLTGLKLMAITIPVLGVCVRRNAEPQRARVFAHCEKLTDMLGHAGAVDADDVWVDDSALAPGYGHASKQVIKDMRKLATHEGLLTDPVYSAKTFSCVFDLLRNHALDRFRHIAVIHTGGTPGLFAYREELHHGRSSRRNQMRLKSQRQVK